MLFNISYTTIQTFGRTFLKQYVFSLIFTTSSTAERHWRKTPSITLNMPFNEFQHKRSDFTLSLCVHTQRRCPQWEAVRMKEKTFIHRLSPHCWPLVSVAGLGGHPHSKTALYSMYCSFSNNMFSVIFGVGTMYELMNENKSSVLRNALWEMSH